VYAGHRYKYTKVALFVEFSLEKVASRAAKLKKKILNSVALVRPSDRRLSAKLVPFFADRGCRVVSSTDPHEC
jgi:hypothetical protein